ncbi:MAG TPA: hypothetical protein VM010_00075 [Chitinophagaceae bacterium]|nr:hypothetical protein [Chitinophagaceae bacterium]
MLLYCHTTTPRLQYVIHFLSRYYKTTILITNDAVQYRNETDNCKLNYSETAILENEIWIAPHTLLFEKGIKHTPVSCFNYNGNKAFFKTGGAFPFDLLAAVFYLLSRYEEYGSHQKDMYGRFAHGAALAFNENFLKTPLINIWLEAFRKQLIQKDVAFAKGLPQFSFEPTYDIDIAWSYKAKGLKRTAGALLSASIKGDWQTVKRRIHVLKGIEKDPFDAYNWLDDLHHRFALKPRYFFLVANQRSHLDKNSKTRSTLFQNLILQTANQYQVGLHPSWQSGDMPALLHSEKAFLETHTKQNSNTSRQHYIRFTLPQTFRHLMAAGITDDYSMGYGSINGFRASVATPFFWYDLEAEKETGMLLHPFCFMDANAYYEQHQSVEETEAELMHYYHSVKAVQGNLCTIWHNHFLGTEPAFQGWRALYQRFVSRCSESGL